MILDAGPLISANRNRRALAALMVAALEAEETLRTTEVVVSQVWRDSSQANLAAALKAIEVHDSFGNGRHVGELMGRAGTSDPVDAHLVVLARRTNEAVLTSDSDDFETLANHSRVRVVAWP
ncbi:MAG: PIN domain-containing protein [Actinomycetia bacterium]|nr:PIN domain-containing protein [Actinomycetes bacterium]MCP4958725.1 PIN domain-containing protein [Actinomycetes bacterium]